MSVYKVIGYRLKTPELVDIPNSSINIQIQQDNSFDELPIPVSYGGKSTLVHKGLHPLSPNYTAIMSESAVGTLWGQVYGTYPTTNTVDYGQGILVDYGLLLKDETLSFGIWNAFNIPKIVSTASVTAGQGISVLSPTPGTVLNPRQEIPLELEISKDGEAVIEAEVVAVVGGEPVSFRIKGIRVKSTYFLNMNWAGGTTTVRRFLTSVYQSGTAAETRKALRHVPIREISTPITYFDKETALQARSTVAICTRQQYGVPVYQDLSISTGDSSPTKVFCDTSYRRFNVGGLAVVIRKGAGGFSTDYFDILTINIVEADGITGTAPLLNSYSRGDLVYPMTVCTPCFQEIGHEVFNTGVGEYTTNSVEVFGSGLELENASYTPHTLRGIPVYPFDINYGEEVSSAFTAFGSFEDSGRGQRYFVASDPDISYSATSLFDSRADWWEALGFFNHIKGQWRKFWYTEPINLFEVADYPSPTEIDLTTSVDALDFEFLRYLHLIDASGSEQVVEVSSIANISGGVRLTVEAVTIGTPIQLRTAKLCRLSADDIEESWLTSSVVTISFQLKELSQAAIT